MNDKIRIHLADDHLVLIEGILAVLKTNRNFEVVGYSLNGVELLDKIYSQKADVLVMDINMPCKDGIDVLKEFAQKGFPCHVIVLSSYDDVKLIKEVIQLGAKGYLTKQCASENIIDAITCVSKGEEYYSKAIREKIFLSFTGIGNDKSANNSDLLLLITDRELEILKLISKEYSGKEISEELFISTNTVETHRKNLIKKLNVKNTIGLVKFAIRNNLINQ